MGRAIPSIASARQFDLEFLVPAHLRGMPLLEDTKRRSDVTEPGRPLHREPGRLAYFFTQHTPRWKSPSCLMSIFRNSLHFTRKDNMGPSKYNNTEDLIRLTASKNTLTLYLSKIMIKRSYDQENLEY